MRTIRRIFHELRCLLLALVVLKSVTAAPSGARSYALRNHGLSESLGLLRRQARHFIEPYWLNPCGDVTASKSAETRPADNKVDFSDSATFKHHYQAIRNYAEALYKQITILKSKKEGGDPFLHSQINLFELARFPQPPEKYEERLAGMTADQALVMAFKLLQFAAVHMSSTEMDEAAFEGPYMDELDDIQRGPNGLQVLMCSIRMAMTQGSVLHDTGVEEELKQVDVSSIRDSSRRNLRDILRLNGTGKILQFIFDIFGNLHQRTG